MRALLTVAALSLTLIACDGKSPTAPPSLELQNCAAYHGCAETEPTPLSKEEEAAQIELARREVQAELVKIPAHAFRSYPPKVVYVACPWRAKNTNFGDKCVAGMTDLEKGRIVVMTFQRNRTAALVKWEAKNWFYCINFECHRAV